MIEPNRNISSGKLVKTTTRLSRSIKSTSCKNHLKITVSEFNVFNFGFALFLDGLSSRASDNIIGLIIEGCSQTRLLEASSSRSSVSE